MLVRRGVLEALLNLLCVIGVLPVKAPADSMECSKTLIAMTIIGLLLFGGLAVFLFHMAKA